MSRRKKRFWADEEKREICAQATKHTSYTN